MRAKFSWNNKGLLSVESEILRRVIKQVYQYQMIRERMAPWKRVPGWIDEEFVRLVGEIPGVEQIYTQSKNILSRLYGWYYKYYATNIEPTVPNLPIIIKLNSHHEYHDVIDILGLGSKITVYDFVESSDGRPTNTMIRNDISALARIWGLYRTSGVLSDRYTRFVISPKAIQSIYMPIKEDLLEKADKIVNYILQGIGRGAFYPSISEQCNTCSYSSQCSI